MILPKIHQEDNQGMTNFVTFVQFLMNCLELVWTTTTPTKKSIDEGMIAFKGRLSFKQYLPAKPTKFGIKVWERASPQNGFCHEFQIYTGKVEGVRTEEGLGSRVIKDLSRHLVGKNHVIHMDNFFFKSSFI